MPTTAPPPAAPRSTTTRRALRPSAVALVALLASTVASAGAGAASAQELPWLELRFTARKALLLGGETRLSATVEECEAGLREPPGADGRPCAEGALVMVEAISRVSFAGTSTTRTWLQAGTAGALQVEERSKDRWKVRRLTLGGHHEWKAWPVGRRERKRAEPPDWSRREQWTTEWPATPEQVGLPPTDSFALLWAASAARLDLEGARASWVAFSDGKVVEVILEAGDLVELDVDLWRREGKGPARRDRGRRAVRRVSAIARAFSTEEEGAMIGLLGMKEGVELFLELGTALPLEVRGRVKGFGGVRVRLVEAALPPTREDTSGSEAEAAVKLRSGEAGLSPAGSR